MRTLGLMTALTLAMSLVALEACVSGPVGNAHPPEPAKTVELDRYLGRWYEFARYDMMFERGCEGVTADYSLRPDGMIRVLNSCHAGAPTGPLKTAEGRAKRVGDALGAKLKVSFFGPFYADYWVLDRADDYSWAIVGEPSGRYLWILTRTPALTPAVRELVLDRARAMGYDLSLLRYTRQL